jgi:hypothetical protein
MTLMQILEEEEREEQEWERKPKQNILVRFLISIVKNILNTLERR